MDGAELLCFHRADVHDVQADGPEDIQLAVFGGVHEHFSRAAEHQNAARVVSIEVNGKVQRDLDFGIIPTHFNAQRSGVFQWRVVFVEYRRTLRELAVSCCKAGQRSNEEYGFVHGLEVRTQQ